MDSNQIQKVFINAFHGLTKLEKLSLRNNLIQELQVGIFNELINLKTLLLSSNKLKSLDGKLLQFNVKLMTFAVDRNELIEIGENILYYCPILRKANFSENKCINEDSETLDLDNVIHQIISLCNLPGKCGYIDFIDGILI